MLIIQLILYCLIFTCIVKAAVIGGAVNGLYFYPKAVQDRAIEIGLTTRESMKKRSKIFMSAFYIIMLVSLILIIGLWNQVSNFKTAYLQALLFLLVMNWYDGIVIDKIWVGHSSFWILPGLEDMPFTKSWGDMFKKRIILSLIWVVGAALVAGLVVLIF